MADILEHTRISQCLKAVALPSLGLGIAFLGWHLATYSEICGPKSTLLADRASLATIVLFGLAVVVLYKSRVALSNRFAASLMAVGIVLQAISLALMGVLSLLGLCTAPLRLVLSSVLMAATGAVLAGWLRNARRLSSVAITTYVFLALAMNGALLFCLRLLPPEACAILAGALMLVQFPVGALKDGLGAGGDGFPENAPEGRALLGSMLTNPRFLATSVLGLFAIILVSGFLCGFPDDVYRPLGFWGNAVLFLITAAISLGVIASTARHRDKVMMVGIWIILELLAGITLVLYTGLHENLVAGAVVSEALNNVMMAAVWYFTVLLMGSGWRDPLYYGCASWVIWFGAHDLGRFLLFVLPVGGDSHFTGSVISLLLLISTQIVLVKLLGVERSLGERLSRDAEEGAVGGEDAVPGVEAPNVLERFLGLDDVGVAGDGRANSIHEQACRMGKQFLLSDRETEVLTLYAMGHTQKRVAEELYISPTTAHTHITRIYSKTNLHSRQELLDFMSSNYGS